ncbi:flavodoxin family protein [Methanosalsum natronophilum]|uniref:Flavodoxin family protein n=1 Tax=Methanosalsum natronophilum TaxID=768733 RepID=A0A3R7VTN1_9EURY|nr:flavodoxin family protein [Methanosalsum natronophilum]MCS3924157.1 multimeric flavodoxin WrbA [Methanosalsum natronophilum]RQD84121.1 MAG: flavodoxin family protein [Methanosalsum natronophilum]
MKILGISGSPVENGNNEILINKVLHIAENRNFETDKLLLSSCNISPCNACDACRDNDTCPIEDDMDGVYAKLKQADAIIVSSPVYFGGMTGQLKCLFDRSVLLRRQGFALNNKLGAAIAVGGSRNGGQEKTIQTIHDCMHVHGMIVIGDGGHFGGTSQKPVVEDDVGMKTVEDTINKMCDVLQMLKQ